MVEFAAQGTELVVEQLDDVEVIEDVDDVGEVFADGPDVGLAHVGGHGTDLGPRRAEPLPEGHQGLNALAVADEDHRSGEEVQDHGKIAVALADRDFIAGDLLQLPQFRGAEPARKRRGLNVLDGVPTHLQVLGDGLDGHVSREVEGEAFEGPRVTLARVGEVQLHLTHVLADEAVDAWHRELDLHGFGADGHGAEGPGYASLRPHVVAAAVRAAELVAGLTDAEGHSTGLEGGIQVAVAAEPEGVIE